MSRPAPFALSDLFGLAGRRVVVTGAGRGLGRGIALAAAAAGAAVLGVSRSEDELAETAALAGEWGGSFVPLPADLSEPGASERLADAFHEGGPVWGLVHAAGGQVRKPATEMTRADWRFIHDVHLEAAFFLSTAVARRQQEARAGGSHLFLTSLGSWLGLRRIAPYAAAKAGVLGVVRTLAAEWAESSIRVNGITPGYFRTTLTEDLLADPAGEERTLSRIPMGRLGTPEDLAGAAIFLLSDASAYVTGQFVNVDGGWLAS